MHCSVCVNYDSCGSFVTGCNNLRREAIVKHNTSKGHRDNAAKEKAKRDSSLGDSTAGRTLLSFNKSVFDRLCNLFRNAHTIAKLGRPYSDYVSLCQLDKAKAGCGQHISDRQILPEIHHGYCRRSESEAR